MFIIIGDGDAACRLPDPPDKLGWIAVCSAISVLTVGTGWTTGATGLVTVGGRGYRPLCRLVWYWYEHH